MQKKLERLSKKELIERMSKEEYFQKEPVPSLIRKYIAKKCEEEKKVFKPK